MTYEEMIELEKKYPWKLSGIGILLTTKEECEEILKCLEEWRYNFEKECKAEDKQ